MFYMPALRVESLNYIMHMCMLNPHTSKAESAKRTTRIAAMICKVRRNRFLAEIKIIEACMPLKLHGKDSFGSLPETCLGKRHDLLHRISRAGKGQKAGGNFCRNLHQIITRAHAQFPVAISKVRITVAFRKPVLRTEEVDWPVLHMSSWVRTLLDHVPELLLAGHQREQVSEWRKTFASFWRTYQSIDGEHDIYTSGFDLSCCCPYFLHGDEGQGLSRRSFLVESFQPTISWKGDGFTNESGYHVTCKDVYFV